MHRILALILSLILLAMVLWIYSDGVEVIGAPVYEYYLENFQRDTGAQNAVTSIYLNYRVFDTLFETLMLLVSVIAVIYFSWRKEYER